MTFDQAYDHLTATLNNYCLTYLEDETFIGFCTRHHDTIENMANDLKDQGVITAHLFVLRMLHEWHNTEETKAMQLHPDNF
jgi:hypothetical protein